MKIEDIHPEKPEEFLLLEIAKDMKELCLATLEILREVKAKQEKAEEQKETKKKK